MPTVGVLGMPGRGISAEERARLDGRRGVVMAWGCEKCRDTGHLDFDGLEVLASRGVGVDRVRWCGCEVGEGKRAEYGAYVSAVEGARLARLFRSAGIPERFRGLTLEGLEELLGGGRGKGGQDLQDLQEGGARPGLQGKRRAIAAARMLMAEGEVVPAGLGRYDAAAGLRAGERVARPEVGRRGLVLWGPPGVGKTGILTPALAHLVGLGMAGLWIEWYAFCQEVQRGYGDGSSAERLEAAMRAEVVLLDDVGDAGRGGEETEDKRRILWMVLNERHGAERLTMVTTNLDEEGFRARFGARTAERLWELAFVVPVGGVNLRRGM